MRGAGDITADNSFLISTAIVFPSLISHDEYYFYICSLIIKFLYAMNLKAKKWMFLLLCGCVMSLHAARVDTLQVYSDKMKRDISVLVFVPDALEGKLPVLFLLHGYGEDETAWSRIANLEQMADANRLLIVCPDGEKSWYWDSPMHPELQFETFISEELPAYIDAHYPTYACREGRAVTGFSMGGHGAMWNAMRHPETFGAVGSTSGGLDIRPFPNNWQMKEQLGTITEHPENWESHTVYNSLDAFLGTRTAIVIDCGYSDFFYKVNLDVHRRLRELNVKHDFYVRPGGHTGTYWSNSIHYQVLFFMNYFKQHLK